MTAAVNAALSASKEHEQAELAQDLRRHQDPRHHLSAAFHVTPDAINRLVAQLAKLPGIGEKTAQRLAFHMLRAPPEYARGLAAALNEVVDKVRCARAASASTTGREGTFCGVCADPRRDERMLCVVEGIADELAIERTREFKGRYHVLHGVLSPAGGHRARAAAHPRAARAPAGLGHRGDHRRHQPRRRGRSHRALPHPPAQADGSQGVAARPGHPHGRRPRVRRSGDPGPGPDRPPRAVGQVKDWPPGAAFAMLRRRDAARGRPLPDRRPPPPAGDVAHGAGPAA